MSDIWLQADQASVSHFPLNDYGWTLENGSVKFKWDTPENIARVVDVVRQLTIGCSCKKGCKTKKCKCHQAHQNCSVSCKCRSCENPHQNIEKCFYPLCTIDVAQVMNNQIPVLSTVQNTSGLTSVTDINVYDDTAGESDNSDNDSDSETEHDFCPNDDEYSYNYLNQWFKNNKKRSQPPTWNLMKSMR